MRNLLRGMAAAMLVAIVALSVVAGESEKYTLRYKFHPGEVLRWQVEHQSKVRATVSGTTQTTETLSDSVKAWRVADVLPDGTATFEHRVEWVDMRQILTGRKEVRYDSRTDTKPPAGFEDAARSVGVPLSVVKIDAKGRVLHRQDTKPRPAGAPAKSAPANATPQNEGWLTIPLPEEPVTVGHTWSLPQDIDVPLPDGTVKKVKAVQQFVLESVQTGVATIRVSTQILTPITDPGVESQLVQRESAGTVRFDIDDGRILGQQIDIDKRVVGFRGEASSIHYVNRFSERLLPEGARTAEKRGLGIRD
jgi:hypothetical protein